MANPQTWTDPATGSTYELIPDTAPAPKTWTDPSSGDTYELIPDTAPAAPKKTAKDLPLSEGLAAGYRVAKDEIPYVQSRRKFDTYVDLANKMGKNVVKDYFSMKALVPGREMLGIDSYDYDSLFNDAKKAGLVQGDRESFEKSFLERGADRGIDQNTMSENPISGFFGGIGSLVNDPLNVGAGIATGGASAGRSVLGTMGIEGGVNALTEALQLPFTDDALENLGQDMDLGDMATRVAMAGGFGAALGGAGRLLKGETPAAPRTDWTDEIKSEVQTLVDQGASVAQIREAYPQITSPGQIQALEWYVANREQGGAEPIKFTEETPEPAAPKIDEAVDEEALPFEAPDFLRATPRKNSKVVIPEPVAKPDVSVDQAVTHINDMTKDWKGAPEFSVAGKLDDLPDDVRQSVIEDGAEDAKGFVRDGKVYILSHNIKNPEELSAVTFHEGLGHVGLDRMFRERLDTVLEQMYKTNEMVRQTADAWLAKNTTQAPNPLAHAVEEILAQTSEGGNIPASVIQKVKAFLKQYARRVPGLKNLKYTDKEVITILSMAHQKVIDGASSQGRAGNRYMRLFDKPKSANDNVDQARVSEIIDREAEFFGIKNINKALQERDFRADVRAALEKEGLDQDAINLDPRVINKYSKPDGEEPRTRGLNVKKIQGKNDTFNSKFIRELEKDLPEKNRQTWEETEALASKLGMNVKKMETLRKGPAAEEIEAGRMFTLGKLNLISDLQEKINNGTATVKEKDQFLIHLRQFVDMMEIMDEVGTTAGRNLNILRKMVVNNKAAVNNVRYALNQAGDNMLDPTRSKLLLDALDDLKKNPKDSSSRDNSKAYDFFINVINIPRTIMSSLDLSAPLRQGIFLINRKEFWKSWGHMLKSFGSEKVYQESLAEIRARPSFDLMEKAGLYIADVDNELTKREEAFMSGFAARLPGVRQSERAYLGFLNKVRADVFDTILKQSQEAGVDLKEGAKGLKDIGNFINNATGRGSIKHIDESMPILNALFFSPRLIASRLQMLNPFYYAKLSPVVRKEALKSAMTLGALAMTIGALAEAGGASVESDPRSSDFMKIRTGDTRYDILGGFGQYITLGARLMTNEKKTGSGEIKKYGSKFGEENRLDAIEKFFENKFSPVASFVADYFRGTDAVGKEFKAEEGAAKRMVPLFLQDAYEITKEQGLLKGAAMAAPGLFGVGTQTYSDDRGGAEVKNRYTDDPAFKEIQRLGGDKNIVSVGDKNDAKTLGIPELEETQLKEYRDYSAELISAATKEAMETPEWQQSSDEEKVKWVKQIGKDMRKMAREDLFGSTEEEEQPEDEYDTQ